MAKTKWKWAPVHKSHRMRETESEMFAPCGTPRFYGVRKCTKCGAKQREHPAGRFMDDELRVACHAPGGEKGDARDE